jgi:hypothetical protein
MLQTPFPKLKKHGPTNLYMIYPMAQRVALVCIEIDKKLTLQRHCPLSSWCAPCSSSKIILAHRPAPTKFRMRHIVEGHPARNSVVTSIKNLNFEFCQSRLHTSAWTTDCWRSQQYLACQQDALLVKYRRTASISTYTH